MMRKALASALLLAGCVMAGPGAVAAQDPLPALAADDVILAFGDSLTAGIGGSGTNYPARLSALVGHTVVNAGVPGETTAQGARRLPGVLARARPALMILCLGVNDFLQKVPRDQVRANLNAMLADADRAAVPVLVLAVGGVGQGAADPVFDQLDVPGSAVVDRHAMADVLGQLRLKSDLVHPNAEGYRQVADAVAATLRSSGALGTAR